MIWMYTECARAQFPEPRIPKNLPQFWDPHEDIFLSLRMQPWSVLPERPARRSKIHCFFGNFVFAVSKKVIVFLGILIFSPVSVPLGTCSMVDHGRSGVRSAPGPLSIGRSLNWVWNSVLWIRRVILSLFWIYRRNCWFVGLCSQFGARLFVFNHHRIGRLVDLWTEFEARWFGFITWFYRYFGFTIGFLDLLGFAQDLI